MITNLHLINFRNHLDLTANFDSKLVVISGQNGVGKTNILEAISTIAPGKSFRGCRLDDIISNSDNSFADEWGVHIQYLDSEFSTGYKARSRRKILMNGAELKSQGEILEYVKILWLLPQMENIFNGAASLRRRFFDRICYNLFPQHAQDIIKYEYHLKSRMKVLQSSYQDNEWLDTLENTLSSLSKAIQKTRLLTLSIINEQISKIGSSFLNPHLILVNLLETDELTQVFKKYRSIDMKSGRSNFGSHKADLSIKSHKGHDAYLCSTGEQKALLVSLILAQAMAINVHNKIAPLMLMDEILAHFDKDKQHHIIYELQKTSSQVWITTVKNKMEFLNNVDNQECSWLDL